MLKPKNHKTIKNIKNKKNIKIILKTIVFSTPGNL